MRFPGHELCADVPRFGLLGADVRAVRISLIWAMARNRVIGRGEGLPWRLPKDMAFFMSTTMGKPVIMGRRTFDTLDRPLPGRTNIVVSRSGFRAQGVLAAPDIETAFRLAEERCEKDGVKECFVAGGADIYALALPRADRLYVTLVDADLDGDTFFPPVEFTDFQVISVEDFPVDDAHAWPFTIRILDRVPEREGA